MDDRFPPPERSSVAASTPMQITQTTIASIVCGNVKREKAGPTPLEAPNTSAQRETGSQTAVRSPQSQISFQAALVGEPVSIHERRRLVLHNVEDHGGNEQQHADHDGLLALAHRVSAAHVHVIPKKRPRGLGPR